MSYKYSVLADNPIVYYSGAITEAFSIPSYQDVLNDYNTYEEFRAAFANYSLDSGNAVVDISGCQNNGFYSGEVKSDIIPLVYGDPYAIKIDNVASININNARGYNGEIVKGGFAKDTFSDNTFSFEVFIYPSINALESDPIPLIGDSLNSVGLFYHKGNILFKLNTNTIEYTLPYKKKAYYLAAVYNKDSAMLYVDGELVSSIDIENFKSFKKVRSGHIHLVQSNDCFTFVGSIFQMDRNDTGDQKGIFVINTDDDTEEFFPNNISPVFRKFRAITEEDIDRLDEIKDTKDYIDLAISNNLLINNRKLRRKLEMMLEKGNFASVDYIDDIVRKNEDGEDIISEAVEIDEESMDISIKLEYETYIREYIDRQKYENSDFKDGILSEYDEVIRLYNENYKSKID